MDSDGAPIAWLGCVLFATLMTVVPLAVYFWSRAAPLGALTWAALHWVFWGFFFTVAIWI
jgi:hypothetical protein